MISLVAGKYWHLQSSPLCSLYAVPSFSPAAGSVSGTAILWGCPSLPVIQFASVHYPWAINPASISFYRHTRKVFIIFGLILQVLAHKKSIMFLVLIQQMEHKFCSIPFPCLNLVVKCTVMYCVIARAANMITLTACTACSPLLSLPIPHQNYLWTSFCHDTDFRQWPQH